MPRNGSGVYSLPSATNPVVTATTITSTWANGTLTDVGDALTGSLARDGSGGMTGALRLADGSIAIPGIAFSAETTTGFSRPTTNALVGSVGGSEKFRLNASGASVTGTLAVSGAATMSSTLAVTGAITATGGVAGAVTSSSATITGGTINGTAIGGTTAAAGAFTTLSYTGTLTGGTGVINIGGGELYKDASGNVGVGTAIPTQKLDVNGTAKATTFSGSASGLTGLPLSTGVSGTLPVANGGTGVTSSTGTGSTVLSNSPTLVSPVLGTPSSGNLSSCTNIPVANATGTLAIANGGTGSTSTTYCSLTTNVTGILPLANGGTGSTTPIVNKNRFANGAFQFDQRNSGTPPTINSSAEVRCQDCWIASGIAAAGVFTVTQTATGGPASSQNFSRITVSTADAAIAAADLYQYIALIEGVDIADLGFGTANARPISIGFWFRASVTGPFSGSVRNATGVRSYVFSFAYTVANVWQQVKIENIPGDTSGTWLTTAARAMLVSISLGAGATFSGAAGSWSGSNLVGVTGGTNLISTLSATMDIALLQVEQGSACTPFEWVPYQAGLARVQRYYEKSYDTGTAPGTATALGMALSAPSDAAVSTYVAISATYTTEKRATPTMSYWDIAGNANSFSYYTGGGLARTDNVGTLQSIVGGTHSFYSFSLPGAGNMAAHHWVASIDL